MKSLLTIALALLLPSLYTIAMMALEFSVGNRVNNRLHVEGEYFNLNPNWKGHSISFIHYPQQLLGLFCCASHCGDITEIKPKV
jgi:hypothetical protein